MISEEEKEVGKLIEEGVLIYGEKIESVRYGPLEGESPLNPEESRIFKDYCRKHSV